MCSETNENIRMNCRYWSAMIICNFYLFFLETKPLSNFNSKFNRLISLL